MRVGLEVALDDASRVAAWRATRVGVLAHPASVDRRMVHLVDRLREAGVKPRVLFGPEHGYGGEAQDMIGVEHDKDSRTGIPVTSLYGETFESLTPTAVAATPTAAALIASRRVMGLAPWMVRM